MLEPLFSTIFPRSLESTGLKHACVGAQGGRVPPEAALPSFAEIQSAVGFPQYFAEAERYAVPDDSEETPEPPSNSSSGSSSGSSSESASPAAEDGSATTSTSGGEASAIEIDVSITFEDEGLAAANASR